MAVPLLALVGALVLWHLAAVAFVLTCLRTFFNPALQASVPRIVPEERLLAANGLLQASLQTATIVGPAIAGLALVVTSPDVLFLLDGLTFFVSALSILFVALAPVPVDAAAPRGTVLTDIGSTVRVIRANPLVFWNVVLFGAGLFTIAGTYRLGVPALARDVLGGQSATYGLLVSSIGIGTVSGALLIGRLRTRRYAPLIFAGWVLWGTFFGLLGVSPFLAVAVGLAVLAGVAESVVTVLMVSLLQSTMPADRLGKVFALWSVLCSAGESSGSLLVGYLLDVVPTTTVFVASGLATIAVGLLGLLQVWRARTTAAPLATAPLPTTEPVNQAPD
jgi:DHA3 family macrolide efflux protein-like MFS transporter